MAKTEFIQARIEAELKVSAEAILHQLGMRPAQAITLLYERISQTHEWPLALKVPNAKTRKALDETEKGIGLKKCKNVETLFKELGI